MYALFKDGEQISRVQEEIATILLMYPKLVITEGYEIKKVTQC